MHDLNGPGDTEIDATESKVRRQHFGFAGGERKT